MNFAPRTGAGVPRFTAWIIPQGNISMNIKYPVSNKKTAKLDNYTQPVELEYPIYHWWDTDYEHWGNYGMRRDYGLVFTKAKSRHKDGSRSLSTHGG